MKEIFCNQYINSTGTNVTGFVPNGIKGIEYWFQQEHILWQGNFC